ncbi:MAG: DegT/DnrJ/EryC1/StrS family aminotransferase [Paludibacteraceae bacterium]|nr:DegT/DnrJ/EryC1/StrS family aminotransferase [Paludibacteraceae bacterium]
MKEKTPTITVTSPLLPPIEEFVPYLKEIWNNKWITNNGQFHQKLEQELAKYLGVEYISVFTNGTLPLITALQALNITGEVITTPYSFVATTHAIWWNGLKPVFVDIDPITGNIDPTKIEAAITSKTSAIMPVHVYGCPCDTNAIQKIAEKHKLKVIYDAAHAFGVKVNGQSILNAGNISTLSFHATKTYNTIEGGALVCHSAEMKQKIDYLKNFGFEDEITIVAPGINSKMDEVRAAYGLLNLKYVDEAIANRKHVAEQYVNALSNTKGVKLYQPIVESLKNDSIKMNYSYFPIFIDAEKFGITRDELYYKMKEQGILGRRYFYPLISSLNQYNTYESSSIGNLPIANNFANSVICLPMHQNLTDNDINMVLKSIKL